MIFYRTAQNNHHELEFRNLPRGGEKHEKTCFDWLHAASLEGSWEGFWNLIDLNWNLLNHFSAINCTQFVIGSVSSCVWSTSLRRCTSWISSLMGSLLHMDGGENFFLSWFDIKIKNNSTVFFLKFPAYLTTPTRHKITVLTRWFSYFHEWQNVFSTNMVRQDRYRSMTGEKIFTIIQI